MTVSPLDESTSIPLPPTVVQHSLPPMIDNVPSREDIQEITEFSDLARNFPIKDPEWPTVMLIGRDCLAAQMQEQSRLGCSDQVMAVKTPLGWALVGKPTAPTRRNKAFLTNTRNKERKKTIHTPSPHSTSAPVRQVSSGSRSKNARTADGRNTHEAEISKGHYGPLPQAPKALPKNVTPSNMPYK